MTTVAASDDGWWALHLRHARGEALSPEEQTVYHQHVSRLDAEEVLIDDLEEWRRQREEIKRLELECNELQSRRRALAEEIAELDALLSGRPRVAAAGR
jgi:hypothetical protein